MKKVTTFILMVFMTVLIMGCTMIDYTQTNGTPMNNKGEYAITFKGNDVSTKALATSVSGTGYDSFNLFTWNSNGTTVMDPFEVDADGTDWVYDGINGQKLQYFSNTADNYDFIGVIPVTKTATRIDGVVTVEDVMSSIVDDDRVSGTLTADSPEEFLWAYANVAKANYGSAVTLPFKHGNALIYLGFKSDRDDTILLDYVPGTPGIPAVPEVRDTTDTWFNLKRNTNVDGSATKLKGPGESTYTDNVALPAALVEEIKSYYSVDGGAAGDYDLHMGSSVWPSATIKELRIVKDIPAAYAITVEHQNGASTTFFDGFKYLKDNGYDIQPRTNGGKPGLWDYILIDAFVNGSAYTIVALNAAGVSQSNPNYTINVTPGTPAIPGLDPIEGVRLFSADSLGENNLPLDTLYCVHIPHTTVADAKISANGLEYENRITSNDVITFSLPSTVTLNSTPVFSATTFYAIPGDVDLNFLVIKLSYTYNGITAYDVRVPVKLPAGGLVAGKYYKYIINIMGTSNGTNDPSEAADEKDEVLIESLYPILPIPTFDDYDEGITQTIDVI